VTTQVSPAAGSAEEVCKSLEQAVLKYFPRPIENVDTFLFAHEQEDASAVGDSRSAGRPKSPTQSALFEVSNAAWLAPAVECETKSEIGN
jgi:hypothetical protein